MNDAVTQIVLAGLAFFTGATAWYAKLKIADSKRKLPKPASEVLFDGYERLLKRYQEAIHERDVRVRELESAFEHVQIELNKALAVVATMKDENRTKDNMITGLEEQLQHLREMTKPATAQ